MPILIPLLLSQIAPTAHAGPPAGVAPWRVDFTRVPVSRTADDAERYFDARKEAIVWSQALRPLPAPQAPTVAHDLVPELVEARLAAGFEIEEANRAVLNPAVVAFAKPGTDFHALHPFCERTGDYDFRMRGWIPVLYRYWDRPDLLWPETRAKILHGLITVNGAKIITSNSFCGIPIPETENHILMTMGSKYLENVLLNRERAEQGLPPLKEFDNARNGLDRWLVRHLQDFLKKDFGEYNSKPYQPYSVMAIQNLYEFGPKAELRTMAGLVLDYLGAKTVISSIGLRRLPPFRRQKPYRDRTELITNDGEMIRMLAMTGAAGHLAERNPVLQWDFGVDFGFYASQGSYRLPEVLNDLVFREEGTETYERIHHAGVEIYARQPEFLVSGGGIYTRSIQILPFVLPGDGWAMPTLLIPAAAGIDATQLIRLDGHRETTRRNNTCVAPGFACGLAPVIPDSIPGGCRTQTGNWTFVDFTSPACPLGYPMYAAVYSAACDTKACRDGAGRFGFFEAAASRDLPFAAFVNRVLGQNGHRRYGAERRNTYLTTDGRQIEFTPLPASRWTWPIVALDSRPSERNMKKWPLAAGRVLRSDGSGRVEIRNEALGRMLVLDGRDPDHPSRYERPIP